MNCLDVRRSLLADPRQDPAALRLHLTQCSSCHAFARQLLQQEDHLQQALAVPVPAQLAERILLANRLRQPRWRPYAWAAAVLLAVLVGLQGYLGLRTQTPASWSEVVLAHVLNEPAALQKAAQVPAQQLTAALHGFRLTPQGNLGHIRYLEYCQMPGGKGLHVVIDTGSVGMITLIVPPAGTHISPGEAAREGFAAQLVPVGNTTVGIVTDQADRLPAITRWLQRALAPQPATSGPRA